MPLLFLRSVGVPWSPSYWVSEGRETRSKAQHLRPRMEGTSDRNTALPTYGTGIRSQWGIKPGLHWLDADVPTSWPPEHPTILPWSPPSNISGASYTNKQKLIVTLKVCIHNVRHVHANVQSEAYRALILSSNVVICQLKSFNCQRISNQRGRTLFKEWAHSWWVLYIYM